MNDKKLSADLEQNVINLRTIMSNSSDLTIKHALAGGHKICIIFCEGMASTGTMANLIFRPLNSIGNDKKRTFDEIVKIIRDELVIAGEQKHIETYDELTVNIMSGFVVILINGLDSGIAIGVQGYESRSVAESSTHSNVRGAMDGFVETVRTNVSLVRRRMKSPDMVFKMKTLGNISNTDICLCYLKNKVAKSLLDEIEKRLDSLPFETILEGGYIQPFLEEKGSGIFSEIGVTDRPDSFAAKLYAGRVGILIDGTPFALYIPMLFTENFTAVDDYTGRPVYASFIRILRYIAYFASILLPGGYVALANFNPELFPDTLLLNLSASLQDTPYPLLPECLLIHIFFEIMREAGLRLPKTIGHAVSIVGGLVIGDIVVTAGLVSAPLVLIVALSAITSFVVPDLYESTVVLRFCYIIAGGIWGILGITVVSAVFIIKVCSMNSYGIPLTAPVSPFSPRAMKDTFIRINWRKLVNNNTTVEKLNGVDLNDKNQ